MQYLYFRGCVSLLENEKRAKKTLTFRYFFSLLINCNLMAIKINRFQSIVSGRSILVAAGQCAGGGAGGVLKMLQPLAGEQLVFVRQGRHKAHLDA